MTKKLIFDVVERAGWTAAQAFLAVFVLADLSTARTAAIAAGGAALSVIKGFVASRVGSSATAATLPASVDPAAPVAPEAPVRGGRPPLDPAP